MLNMGFCDHSVPLNLWRVGQESYMYLPSGGILHTTCNSSSRNSLPAPRAGSEERLGRAFLDPHMSRAATHKPVAAALDQGYTMADKVLNKGNRKANIMVRIESPRIHNTSTN